MRAPLTWCSEVNTLHLQNNEKVVTTEEEEEITLYDKNDYFVRSPRFVEVVEKEDFKLDAPPNNNEQEEMPFILTIGPMITMASTSLCLCKMVQEI